jgi:hypothetical protein
MEYLARKRIIIAMDRADGQSSRGQHRVAVNYRELLICPFSVARNLSGRHSHQKEGTNEADGAVTGDAEDEISRSV